MYDIFYLGEGERLVLEQNSDENHSHRRSQSSRHMSYDRQ